MRVLFLGMSAPFSQIVLDRLLSSGVNVAAILLAGTRFRSLNQVQGLWSAHAAQGDAQAELPIVNPNIRHGAGDQVFGGYLIDNIASTKPTPAVIPVVATSLATEEKVEIYECGNIDHPDVVEFMDALSFDIACVACWHRKIPAGVLGIPSFGFLNVHPSLLPAYRGPQPLFWQFRAGETRTGVTVHWMDAGLDTGDIATQKAVRFADGIRLSEAEALCASAGGRLLAEALRALEQGQLERRPQKRGSFFPTPSLDDFAVDAGWPVRRAFNFVRAAAGYGVPFHIEAGGKRLWFADAVAWYHTGESATEIDGCIGVQFRDGVMWARECPGPPM